jgi:hemolysin activation/secretion protein
VAYSYLEYALGREFEALHAHGTAKVASIFGSYPLIRSRNNNLYVQVAYDERKFQDKIDVIPSVTDKKAHVLMESLYGDSHDMIGGGGQNAYFLTLSQGKLDIQTPDALFSDSQTARTNGRYNKANFGLMRLQHVTNSVSLYASIIGQIASKNLDVSEKMELGGMYGVRAYPEGEAYADQGYILTLEARLNLPKFSENQLGQMQLIAFVDTGYVTINKNTWVDGSNSRRLSGAGVGFNWWDVNNFSIKAYYAHKLGSAMATSAPDKSGRFWIQLVKYF